jgi:hypothetical protein
MTNKPAHLTCLRFRRRDRGLVGDCAQWPFLVAVPTPSSRLFEHIHKRKEPVSFQVIRLEPVVERLKKAFHVGFPKRGKTKETPR